MKKTHSSFFLFAVSISGKTFDLSYNTMETKMSIFDVITLG